jgi:hypothetical protein
MKRKNNVASIQTDNLASIELVAPDCLVFTPLVDNQKTITIGKVSE